MASQGLLSRASLVAAKTQLINHVRGTVKAVGAHLPLGGSDGFHQKLKELIPEELHSALHPVLEAIASLNEQVKALDNRIAELNQAYPETDVLRQVSGVGPITSLAF